MTLPTLRQLQYLVSLHEHMHFSRAADACHVTQSTLSAGLKELEAILGAQLVERTRRVTLFTPLGVRAAARAKDMLRQARDLTDLARIAAVPLSGTLRLSVIPTIAPFLLPRLLPTLKAACPDLQVVLHEEMSHWACQGLARGARDCLVLALPFPCDGLDHVALFDDDILVALHADDPLAAQPTIAPADLPADRLLLLDDGHCLRDHALGACERRDLEHGPGRGAGVHTLVQLVGAGMGLSLIPAMAVEAGVIAGTPIVTRSLDTPKAHRTVALAWRRNTPRAEEFALLAQCIRQGLAAAKDDANVPAFVGVPRSA
ncbi:LysR family transcriptional regulator [Caulobacter sp. D4A]|uniref:hydrogen peroxide-inducible genes activator n=1 Tax=unclassified Caulobacter TaxID=2648921 RepID=UPI000D738722|nr:MULTISPECIES: hydrogen peroxide-inducible genes activator [unclassified Caulobacter]PXA91907.1 LysR family transcriptional regulator [Caulobacter sp. D5]PXA93046.1 LysR family transcriptional regulator [Caulobacter sp. D4A]